MNKREFTDRLILAGTHARAFADSYVSDSLPETLCYTVDKHDNQSGQRGPAATIKFLGGRFLYPHELVRISPVRAAQLLWVDGMVPAWINIAVWDCDEEATELLLTFCSTLLPAEPSRLPPDLGMPAANELVPFRIRGPVDSVDWRRRNRLKLR